MSKATDELLELVDDLGISDNIELSDAYDALSELGEDAKATSNEYKTLKAIVDSLKPAKREDDVVKVKLKCVYGSNKVGSVIELSKDEADSLLKVNFVEIV